MFKSLNKKINKKNIYIHVIYLVTKLYTRVITQTLENEKKTSKKFFQKTLINSLNVKAQFVEIGERCQRHRYIKYIHATRYIRSTK